VNTNRNLVKTETRSEPGFPKKKSLHLGSLPTGRKPIKTVCLLIVQQSTGNIDGKNFARALSSERRSAPGVLRWLSRTELRTFSCCNVKRVLIQHGGKVQASRRKPKRRQMAKQIKGHLIPGAPKGSAHPAKSLRSGRNILQWLSDEDMSQKGFPPHAIPSTRRSKQLILETRRGLGRSSG